MSIELVMLSNHPILYHPLLLLPSIFPSIRALHIRWPKYWSFSLSNSPSDEYSGLISFRIAWFDLAVQGTLKSLLQHYNSKASVLRHPVFFMVMPWGQKNKTKNRSNTITKSMKTRKMVYIKKNFFLILQ